jgi:hypothetical protein
MQIDIGNTEHINNFGSYIEQSNGLKTTYKISSYDDYALINMANNAKLRKFYWDANIIFVLIVLAAIILFGYFFLDKSIAKYIYVLCAICLVFYISYSFYLSKQNVYLRNRVESEIEHTTTEYHPDANGMISFSH